MNLAAFAVVVVVARTEADEDIDRWAGLGRRQPLAAFTMTIALVALAGLPPTAGFIGKYYLFAAVIAHGREMGQGMFYAAALIAVLNSVVSLYYYARVVRAMYIQPAGPESAAAAAAGAAAAGAAGAAAAHPGPGPVLGAAGRTDPPGAVAVDRAGGACPAMSARLGPATPGCSRTPRMALQDHFRPQIAAFWLAGPAERRHGRCADAARAHAADAPPYVSPRPLAPWSCAPGR